MGYQISGNASQSTRILIIDASDWSTEHTGIYNGDYEITVTSGSKIVLGRLSDGQSIGFGSIQSVYVANERGVWAGGRSPDTNTIDYVTISTTGDAQNFGDLTLARRGNGAASNGASDRGVFAGGLYGSPSSTDRIDYITISTTTNASDFGNLTVSRQWAAGTSNGVLDRGIFAGGDSRTNLIDYITISSTGDAADFGDLTEAKYRTGAVSNATNNRGVVAGGTLTGNDDPNTIEYITISTTGNAIDFGDLLTRLDYTTGTSNGVNDRGVYGSGLLGANSTNVIEYITISTPSNSQDFGDLSFAGGMAAATSDGTNNRGVFGGRYHNYNDYNIIDYIAISTTGNAQDFGDLTVARYDFSACSNA